MGLGGRGTLETGLDDRSDAMVEVGVDDVDDRFDQHVELDVDGLADRFSGQDDLGLGVGDEHDREGGVESVDGGDGERDAVDGHVALGDQVVRRARRACSAVLDGHPDRVSVGDFRDDGAGLVDVSLHEVSTESSRGR